MFNTLRVSLCMIRWLSVNDQVWLNIETTVMTTLRWEDDDYISHCIPSFAWWSALVCLDIKTGLFDETFGTTEARLFSKRWSLISLWVLDLEYVSHSTMCVCVHSHGLWMLVTTLLYVEWVVCVHGDVNWLIVEWLIMRLAPHVADMSATCRRHVHMSPNLGRHCVSLRHRRGPDIPNLYQLLPTITNQPKHTGTLATLTLTLTLTCHPTRPIHSRRWRGWYII